MDLHMLQAVSEDMDSHLGSSHFQSKKTEINVH